VRVAVRWPDDSLFGEEWWRLRDREGRLAMCMAFETAAGIDLVVCHGDRIVQWKKRGPLWRVWSFSEQLRLGLLDCGWNVLEDDSPGDDEPGWRNWQTHRT
jgi:hypothetical protein